MSDLQDALVRTVRGDASALGSMATVDHDALVQAAVAVAPLVVTREATIRVLEDLRNGRLRPEVAQCWASFMRRGYIEAVRRTRVIRPIHIEYQRDVEDVIADAVSRLDEIGDLVDGVLTRDEIDVLLARLA